MRIQALLVVAALSACSLIPPKSERFDAALTAVNKGIAVFQVQYDLVPNRRITGTEEVEKSFVEILANLKVAENEAIMIRDGHRGTPGSFAATQTFESIEGCRNAVMLFREFVNEGRGATAEDFSGSGVVPQCRITQRVQGG